MLLRNLAVGTDETVTRKTDYCRRALRLARQTRRSDSFVQNVLTWACDAIQSNCRFDNEFDDEICGPVRQRRMENRP